MLTESLLGHLALRFPGQTENLATESLLYLINSSPAAKRAFLTFSNQVGVNLPITTVFHFQEICPSGAIPDLVGCDPNGNRLLILEAKFWAGLTENQPVGYIAQLPPAVPGVLLFVVPGLRLNILSTELSNRCRAAGLDIGPETVVSSELRFRTVQSNHVLALVSWRAILAHLVNHLNAESDMAALANVHQLRGLCSRMDDDAFLPLQSDEFTSTIPSRLLQYKAVVDDVITVLLRENLASVAEGLNSGGFYYRPIRLRDFTCYLHLSLDWWKRHRYSPIWLSVTGRDWKLSPVLRDSLRVLEAEDPPCALVEDNKVIIPLSMPLGVERQVVLDSLVEQVRRVVELLPQ